MFKIHTQQFTCSRDKTLLILFNYFNSNSGSCHLLESKLLSFSVHSFHMCCFFVVSKNRKRQKNSSVTMLLNVSTNRHSYMHIRQTGIKFE